MNSGSATSTIVAGVNPRAPRRGDVWSVQFDERRPVLLLAVEGGSAFRSIQLVDPAGEDISGYAVEVSVGIEDGLPFEKVVRFAIPKPGFTPCTWLANLDREDLIEWIGAIPEGRVEAIEDALGSAGLDPAHR
jgi:mRNA interferase MazF